MLNKLMELLGRAISRLCLMAEAVESDQGYQPLAVPEGVGLVPPDWSEVNSRN